MSLAKKGLDSYQGSDNSGNAHKTGGHEFNEQPGGGSSNPPWFNESEVVSKASSEGSGDPSMFSSALAFINSSPDKHEEPIDEERATEAHNLAYSERSPHGLSANSMGTAAAMEIMKKFTGGGDKHDSKKPQSKTDLVSLAMAEASKLFDKHGGSTQGTKQDAVNSAGMTIMKLLVQSKFSGTTGGKDSGGLGGLMSMANKFM